MARDRANALTVVELSELAGGLAHEIRNPLSTLKVNLQLLAEDLRDERPNVDISADFQRRSLNRLDTLQAETQRLQNLLDDFLKSVGHHDIHTAPIDLNTVVSDVVRFFSPQAAGQRITIETQLAPEKLVCHLDVDLFKQALINLVVNALQAMPTGGTLTLTTSNEDQSYGLTVHDTGTGIEEALIDRVFSPFFSTKKEGTGLGLSTTRRIVHEHRGEITVLSKPDVGTTFTIVLPRSAH